MRLRSSLFLLRISLKRRARHHLGVAGGMAIGMLALAAAAIAGPGLAWTLSRHLQSLYPAQRVVLRPKAGNMIWLQVETTRITTETVARVRTLPGVLRVSPEATLRFPASAVASLLGNTYQTDISVTGVEPWLLGDDAPPAFTYDPAASSEVPAVLARYFLDLYNMTLAESNSLPKLSPAAAIGRHFELILGQSSIRAARPDRPARRVDCRIVALGSNPDLLGLVVPLEAVEHFNALYRAGPPEYRSIHVELDRPEALESLKPRFEALGLTVLDRAGPWRRVVLFIGLAGAGFIALGALVFALALAYMASSLTWMLSRRRRELALYQALGADAPQVRQLLMTEVAIVCGTGLAAGWALAAAAQLGVNRWYAAWRGTRDYLPASLLGLPWPALGGLAAAGAAICLTVAWVLVRRAVGRSSTR